MRATLSPILMVGVDTISCSDFHYAMAMASGAGNSSSSVDRNYSISQGSNVPYQSETFFHNFTPNNGGEENPFESSSGKDDERDNGGTSKTDDFEVRMDLTDDLLHMVHIVSQHTHICTSII